MSQQPAEIDTEYTWPPDTATEPQVGDRYDPAHGQRADRCAPE